MSEGLISTEVNVASNEYLTKFSINRNFVKLISNDNYLMSKVADDNSTVYSYNPYKKYAKGDLAFFKTALTAQNTYLLSSLHDDNDKQPLCITNVNDDVVVINGADWSIVGIPALSQLSGHSPTDIADEYILSSQAKFIEEHQDNRDLSAHPLGKFCRQDSTVLFTDITNIQADRSKFFYPYKVQKLIADDTILDGYMRKWDNGILEYDIIFRVGFQGKTEEGYDLLEANNTSYIHRNFNYLYFKDKKDYSIFTQGGDYQAMMNNQKQVNLNKQLNAYAGQITFPEEFKDLNYMVFSSNVKNITTRTYNTKNEAIDGYDSRLSITGLTIQSHLTSQDEEEEAKLYRSALDIPLSVENIATGALAGIKSDYPNVVINMLSNANLINIDDDAFRETEITSISIPYATRHIGEDAFRNCAKLKELTVYVHDDKAKQVKIEQNAFLGTPNLTSITLVYDPKLPPLMMASPNALTDISEEDRRLSAYSSQWSLEEKLRDYDIRTYMFGISSGFNPQNIIVINGTPMMSSPASSRDLKSRSMLAASSITATSLESSDEGFGFATTSIKDALNHLKSQKKLTAKASSRLMISAAPTSENLSDFFDVQFNDDGHPIAISGWKSDMLTDDFEFNSAELLRGNYSGVTAINESSFSDCTKITSFIASAPLEVIYDDAFIRCSHLSSIVIADGVHQVKNRAFSQIANIKSVTLSCSPEIIYDSTAFQSTTIQTLSIFQHSELNFNTSANAGYLVVNADQLCADMTGCLFQHHSLSGSSIGHFYISSILKGKAPAVGSKGFNYNALFGCTLNTFETYDQSIDIISNMFIDDNITYEGVSPKNLLGMNDRSLVKGKLSSYDEDDPSVIVYDPVEAIIYDNIVQVSPMYLSVNNMLEVISCNFNFIEDDSSVSIPRGCVSICADVFVPDDQSKYKISAIIIPNTMIEIGDNAFKGNKSLAMISVQDNTLFQAIGTDIVLGCYGLDQINVLSSIEI